MEIGWLKCCTIFLKDASYVVNMKIIQKADKYLKYTEKLQYIFIVLTVPLLL